jgi:antitoxin StbD
MSSLVPISEARAHLSQLVREATEADVVLMNHGRPAAVLVSAGRYESLLEELEDLRDRLSVHEREHVTMPFDKFVAELGIADDTAFPRETATPRKSFRRKLRWTDTAPRDHRNWAPQWAEGDRGERYVISGAGDIYEASVRLGDGTTTILASGVSHPQAYRACVRHYHGPL